MSIGVGELYGVTAMYFQHSSLNGTQGGNGAYIFGCGAGKLVSMDVNGQVGTNNPAPTSTNHYTRKDYVDGKKWGASSVNTGKFNIARIPTGTTSATVALGNHNHNALYMKKSAPVATATLQMGNHKISHLANGTTGTDAVNKAYVDFGFTYVLKLAGGTMSGSIAMGNHSITGLPKQGIGAGTAAASMQSCRALFRPISDRRVKENILPIGNEDALERIMCLAPVSFNYKKGTDCEELQPTKDHFGLIAQEAQSVIPELVYEGEVEGIKDGLAVNYTEIIALLISAVQAQQKQLDAYIARP